MQASVNNLPALEIAGLRAGYGGNTVLHDVGLSLDRGQVVALIGRNGAGKTTTLKAIMGLIPRSGSIRCGDTETVRMAGHKIAHLGLGYCPEDRGIFASLTVEENILLPPAVAPGGLSLDEIYALFPNLGARRNGPGSKLSGGEQQMLAIGRLLRTGASVLLLDEPTEGLAPIIVEQIGKIVHELKSRGMTILLVEQNFGFTRALADVYYVIESGRIVDSCTAAEMASAEGRLRNYLGL